MDPRILELAQKVGTFLLPLLPYLLKVGDKAAEEVGKKIGGEAWERAKALWAKLGRKERVQKAAEAAVTLPDNPAIRQGVETEIARALAEDPALRQEIVRLWDEAEAASVTVTAVGDRSVAVGGSVSGSMIVTGDQNGVQQSKYNIYWPGRRTGHWRRRDRQARRRGVNMLPIGDFLTNLAASLVYDLLRASAEQLSTFVQGSPEKQALRRCYQAAFAEMLAEVTTGLDADQRALVEEILRQFVTKPDVAGALLDLALAGAEMPDLPALRTAFDALDFDRATLPVNFDRALTAFTMA